MTIKTQNGKVITKDGKVSCECCEEPPPPGECCLYPAQALLDGLYAVDDLPDEIIVFRSNETLPVFVKGQGDDSTAIPGAKYAPDGWPGPDEEFLEDTIYLGDSGRWESGPGISNAGVECLISEFYGDTFADTYTVTWNFIGIDVPPASVVVTRESLCVWRGTDPCGNVIFLYYGDSVEIGGGLDYTWNLRLNNYVDGCGNPDFLNYIINKDRDAPSFQNSPVGYYPEIFATDATVS